MDSNQASSDDIRSANLRHKALKRGSVASTATVSVLAASFMRASFGDNHNPADPRVIIVPMVDWNSPKGRSQVKIEAFAALWVDSISGGTIQAYFIDQEVFHSTGDPNAPFRGTRGRALLIK